MSRPGRAHGAPEAPLRAIVLFDTRYGNTEKVARALTRGIELGGVEAQCFNISGVDPGLLLQFDFVAVGGPTQYRTASQPMQAFLLSLGSVDLFGKMGFAFDTRKESFWAGSAAKYIEKSLTSRGIRMIWPSLSAWVYMPASASATEARTDEEDLKELRRSQVRLGEKMEELFERTGGEIGKAITGPT